MLIPSCGVVNLCYLATVYVAILHIAMQFGLSHPFRAGRSWENYWLCEPRLLVSAPSGPSPDQLGSWLTLRVFP